MRKLASQLRTSQSGTPNWAEANPEAAEAYRKAIHVETAGNQETKDS